MDKAGFKTGDIIEKVNGFDIRFPRDVGKSMDGVKPTRKYYTRCYIRINNIKLSYY